MISEIVTDMYVYRQRLHLAVSSGFTQSQVETLRTMEKRSLDLLNAFAKMNADEKQDMHEELEDGDQWVALRSSFPMVNNQSHAVSVMHYHHIFCINYLLISDREMV